MAIENSYTEILLTKEQSYIFIQKMTQQNTKYMTTNNKNKILYLVKFMYII